MVGNPVHTVAELGARPGREVQIHGSARMGDSPASNRNGCSFASAVRRSPVSSAVRLPLPDGVGQVRHPRGGLRADRLQGHAARVHALEQADPGAEQHG